MALALLPTFRGAVAQLGERLNGIQEVDGSIPFGSTKNHTETLATSEQTIQLTATIRVAAARRRPAR